MAVRRFYVAVMLVGIALLIAKWPIPHLQTRWWPSSGVGVAFGLASEVIGLSFTVWARVTIGADQH